MTNSSWFDWDCPSFKIESPISQEPLILRQIKTSQLQNSVTLCKPVDGVPGTPNCFKQQRSVVKSLGSGIRQTWVPILMPPLDFCVNLGKFLNFSETQFPHLQNETADNSSFFYVLL